MVSVQQYAQRLVIFVIVMVCVKFYFNISVLNMANVVGYKSRKWSNLAENYANRHPEESVLRKRKLDNVLRVNEKELDNVLHVNEKELDNVLHVNEKEQNIKVRDANNIVSTTDVKTSDIPYQTNSQAPEGTRKVGKSTLNSYTIQSSKFQSQSSNMRDNIQLSLDKLNTVVISNKLNVTYSSKNKKVYKKHPHEKDFEMIASGKFVLEDLMKQGPFKFLKNFKSPCWKPYSRSSSEPPIRCLPYFYLIGAPKSGTTDMHRRLIKHPEISKLVIKEPHWLTRRQYYNHGINGGYSNLTNYVKLFTFATRDLLLRTDATGYHNVIFGDCSASTMWDNDYWTILPQFRNLSEPLYTNADYIHHLNPNAKIIAMLRNPVERLYSDYMFFQHGSPQKFHEGVKSIIKDTNDCLKYNSLRHCIYTPAKTRTGLEIRLRIGVYHVHLKEYFRVFPRDQVMVIKLEDFSNNTVSYMRKLFSFLEISELNRKDLKKIADPDQHANTRRKKDKKAGEMLPETRKMLENFYRPHNQQLSDLLGEKFNYNKDFEHA